MPVMRRAAKRCENTSVAAAVENTSFNPSQRVQLQVEVDEQDYLRQSKASVANGKICFTCPNLLPNANQVVAARSGASGPCQRTLNHPHGHHDGAKSGGGSPFCSSSEALTLYRRTPSFIAFGRATTGCLCLAACMPHRGAFHRLCLHSSSSWS